MLSPKDRTLLLEALRPPPGSRLDIAVSTTYSLDLMALLVAPLAFTFFDWEGEDGQPTRDPNALLEAIRRHVDRIHVFCQAGQIAVPNTYQQLFSYLEPSVHEVRAPRKGGVFHPKVWVLRYVADGESPKYRLLCASRNLTFDRSWDTLLVLDGVAGKKAIKTNEPLTRFVRALPGLSVQGLEKTAKQSITVLADEIGRVEFELPEGIESIDFWPLGLPGDAVIWPFPKHADRGLVISPFLAEGALDQLNVAKSQTLISRVDSLAAINPDHLAGYENYALSDGADFETEDEADAEASTDENDVLSGLHAKIFAFDTDGLGRVWTGSANATNAAFHSNVEFLVEMRGPSKTMGVEAILNPQEKGISVLRDLLVPFTPGEKEIIDQVKHKLDQMLMMLRRYVVDLEIELHAEMVDEDHYDLRLSPTSDPVRPECEFELYCWPLTLKQDAGTPHFDSGDDESLLCSSLSFEGLTTFFAFEGRVTLEGKTGSCRFVLNLPASGFPDNRHQRLLRYMLKDRNQVMRYLFLLLGDDSMLTLSDFTGHSGQGNGGPDNGRFHADIPMLEALVKALERDPGILDQVAGLVQDLQSTEKGRELLPEDFDEIWSPLWEARGVIAKSAK